MAWVFKYKDSPAVVEDFVDWVKTVVTPTHRYFLQDGEVIENAGNPSMNWIWTINLIGTHPANFVKKPAKKEVEDPEEEVIEDTDE